MKTTILLIALLMAISFSALSQNVGEKAPDFSFIDLDDNQVTLSQYKGKVVALFIFGYACTSCAAIAPSVQTKIQDVYGNDDGFVLLGLDQWDGNKAGVESFKSKTGVTFPLLQKASGIAKTYTTTYDRIIVIDPEGYIAFKGTKLVSSDLDAAIASINSLLTTTSIENIESTIGAAVYPNPFVSTLNFQIENDKDESIGISIINIGGKLVYQSNTEIRSTFAIDLSGLTPGMYIAEISKGNKKQAFRVEKQ
ncbi:MAG: T9SS type A sorting domain-containing protein [Prolixibacteraceae bacterium]|nr:T9SS type A sorting domain-containing protein [Prolixibacteraceae bacterium]